MSNPDNFQALVLREAGGNVTAAVESLSAADLPEGEVLVEVANSTINYKDALAITNSGKIVRSFPMVPGVDFAGTVAESSSDKYNVGDAVVLTGWGVGERHWGGLSQYARVKADWLVPLPQGLSSAQAMGVGTAGFTAMLCVNALVDHGVTPESGEVLVTGAAGGVGSFAVAILARMGYKVVAASHRDDTHDYLLELGAAEVIDSATLTESKRPMDSERWAGAIDVVGGAVMAGVLKGMAYGSTLAACGLAGGHGLDTTVFPFILRGVTLAGVDSVMCPYDKRVAAWQRIAEVLPAELMAKAASTNISLAEVPALCQQMMQGQVKGRAIVDLKA
jgi:acrylyl-CoA reductase (NADPH)